MKLLAIDSSGLVASVALMVDDILVGEYTIHNKKTHSQTLLPMIADMMEMAGVDKHELTAIAVAAGPGSFTGLRIGAATAKGLAQALEIPIVPVSTLEGLAYNLQGADVPVCPIMDARRSQVYYGIYDVSGELPVSIVPEGAEPITTVMDQVKELDKPVIFLGDGVPVFREQLGEARVASEAVRYQRASSVATLARQLLLKEQAGDDPELTRVSCPAAEFAPHYLRPSQAEREAAEREKEAKKKGEND